MANSVGATTQSSRFSHAKPVVPPAFTPLVRTRSRPSCRPGRELRATPVPIVFDFSFLSQILHFDMG